jgi:hypothetical protein
MLKGSIAGDAAGPGTESEFGLESETDGEARGESRKVSTNITVSAVILVGNNAASDIE